MTARERILVAMSGGVDSAVAAALLAEAGHEVIGITMQLWPATEDSGAAIGLKSCCSLGAVQDARRVAARLGLRHYVLNFREAFRRLVREPFAEAYRTGRTPNPCIWCNHRLKFGVLLQRAQELDCDAVATGHYARRVWRQETGRWAVARGKDPAKDQSYVLYGLTQEQLARARFPLGDLLKSETRRLAAGFGLPVAEKPESQEICFVPEDDYAAYLRREAPDTIAPGPILDLAGREIGRHEGIAFYTIGQRRRLGLNGGQPHYVVDINPEQKAVIVGPEAALYGKEVWLEELNYGAWSPPTAGGGRLRAMLRYRMPAAPCSVRKETEGRVRVTFYEPQRAVTPGQAGVLYDDDCVALGGVIARRPVE